MKNLLKVALIAILLVIGAYMLVDNLNTAANVYVTVSDVAEKPQEFDGKEIQVMGTVESGSVKNLGDRITFALTDNRTSLTVISTSYPSGLQESKEVVVIGTFNSDMTITADRILVKCPSKYQELPEGEAQAAIGSANP
ncbi:MAG: cytochrome c maturation protein CcmE [Candidatus Bathyarchaeia archaeon]